MSRSSVRSSSSAESLDSSTQVGTKSIYGCVVEVKFVKVKVVKVIVVEVKVE